MNGDNPGCAGGMWYDVGCNSAKNLAVCRVANTKQPTSQAPTLPTLAPTVPTAAPTMPTKAPTMSTNAPSAPTIAPSLGAFRFEILEDAEPFIYAAAKARCESVLNGVLSKIDNQADYDTVAAMIAASSYANKQAWIGLNDIGSEGAFYFVEDDTELGAFQPWCAPNPNNLGGNENCVVMNGDTPECAGGMWYDVSCATEKNLAVCTVATTIAPSLPTSAPSTPTTAPSQSAFRLEILEDADPFIYAAAKARCESVLNGMLAKIDNQGDYDEVAAMIAASSFANKQAWIGLNDLDVEGTFRYVEDDSVLGAFQVGLYIYLCFA
jgi:hypothetical protein